MTKLRRCSPEIERELHDKEARIRELEGALRRLIDAETKYRWTHDLKGDDHLDTGRAWDRMRKASVEANDLLANSPPDSEPAAAPQPEQARPRHRGAGRARRGKRVTSWQPIETAPRDEWIRGLGVDKNGDEYTAYLKMGRETDIRDVENITYPPVNLLPAITFTHWKPLPEQEEE